MSNHRYDIGSSICYNVPLKIRYISTSKFEKDWHSTMHSHNYTELFYVLFGQGEFRVEEAVFSVSPSDMVIINSEIEHTERSVYQSPMEYIVLGFEGGDILLQDSNEQRYCAFKCDNVSKEIEFYLREILRELGDRPMYYSTVANSMLEILYIKLLRHKSVSIQLEPTKKGSRECEYIKRYIDNNFVENITLDLLAEITHLSKFYIAHTFTKEFGISPINYLNQKRIEESRYYLINTSYTIIQIAQLLGFSSGSYFSQRFAKTEKISPREYRKKYRNA